MIPGFFVHGSPACGKHQIGRNPVQKSPVAGLPREALREAPVWPPGPLLKDSGSWTILRRKPHAPALIS